MKATREKIDAGQQIGPRIYNSGPYFGTARPTWDAAEETPDRIRQEVDEWAAKGVRGFKAKGIQPAQLEALIERAHQHGLTVTAHLDSGFRNSVNPRDAILMGIDRIEHFTGGDAITGDRPAYASLENLDVNSPGGRRRDRALPEAPRLLRRDDHGLRILRREGSRPSTPTGSTSATSSRRTRGRSSSRSCRGR